MIKRIIFGVLALLVVAAGVVTGVYYWNKLHEPNVIEGETEIALSDDVLEVPETTEPEVDVAPELPGEEPVAEIPAVGEEIEVPLEEDAAPLSPEIIEPDAAGSTRAIPQAGTVSRTTVEDPRETRPASTEDSASRPASATTVTTTTTTAPASEDVPSAPAESTTLEAPSPTPTPEAAATPTPAAGNYSVHTLTPVMKSKLAQIRNAMQPLGVQLQEQQTAQVQSQQAYRVAVGFFRTKAEAKTWAQNYFRPKKIDYFVFPAQGMFSIQVGVYTQQANVDKKMRELHQKFPGWRLPLRTEPMTMSQTAYHLSIRGIQEDLARNVQNALVRLGVQAELAGM